MQEFFVTFGAQYNHVGHPTWRKAHPDGYVVIEAENYGRAREICSLLFERAWSNMYDSLDDLHLEYYPRGELGRFDNDGNKVFTPPKDHVASPIFEISQSLDSSIKGVQTLWPVLSVQERLEWANRLRPELPMCDGVLETINFIMEYGHAVD